MELEATSFADPNSVRTLSGLVQLYNSYLAEIGGIREQLSTILAETSPDKAIRHTDLFPPHIL